MCSVVLPIFYFKKRSIIIALFCICNAAPAQEISADSTHISIDSAYTDDDESNVRFQFDTINQTDAFSYQPLQIPDSVVNHLKNDEAFWYANIAPKQQKQKTQNTEDPSEPFYLKQWFRTLVWVLVIGGFLAVLIWFLVASDVKFFRKKPVILYQSGEDELPEDIFSINYKNELAKAVAAKNYRLGVRLMYLHTLKMAAEKQLIKYKAERTNSDYLADLYNTPFYKDFFSLTRSFEYVWYGEFKLSEETFALVQKKYDQLKQRLT